MNRLIPIFAMLLTGTSTAQANFGKVGQVWELSVEAITDVGAIRAREATTKKLYFLSTKGEENAQVMEEIKAALIADEDYLVFVTQRIFADGLYTHQKINTQNNHWLDISSLLNEEEYEWIRAKRLSKQTPAPD